MDVLAAAEMLAAWTMAIAAKFAYLDGFLRANTALASYLGLGLLLAVILHLTLTQCGLYRADALLHPRLRAGRLIACVTVSFLFVVGLLYLLKIAHDYSRGWLLVWYGLTLSTLLVGRGVARLYARLLIAERRVRDRVAIYGDGALAREVGAHLARDASGLSVIGIFQDKAPPATIAMNDSSTIIPFGSMPTLRMADAPVSGNLDALLERARNGEIDKIVVALPGSDSQLCEVMARLAVLPLSVLYCPELKQLPINVRGIESLGDLQLLVVQNQPLSDRARILKGAMDYTLTLLALVLLAPLFLAIAIAIKLDSPGPVFFRQRRDGYNGSVIRVLKFRTMTVTEDGPVIRQAVPDDPRITRVGRFLRRTSLDELPQLFTVLSGEMSLVGPRPHAVAHGREYARLLDQYVLRHRMKPGLTGWAQVNGYRGATEDPELMRKRVEHDIYYIENWSIWLDIEILIRTVLVVLRGHNAY